MMNIEFKRIRPENYDFILSLNEQNIEVLSPIFKGELCFFERTADLFELVCIDGLPVGFCIALREDIKEYDLRCYRWFRERYPKYLYIDRIVVSEKYRRLGIGKRIYNIIFNQAWKNGVKFVAAGITTAPYNESSLKFHQALGFSEVGEETIRNGTVKVSMQIAEVGEEAFTQKDIDKNE